MHVRRQESNIQVAGSHSLNDRQLAPIWLCWRHISASLFYVRSVQIKNVPDDVHHILRRRAAAAGQSLQEYLLSRLTAEARHDTLDDVLDRAGGRAGGTVPFSTAIETLRSDRHRT